MLDVLIEQTRKEMFDHADQYGFTSTYTVQSSQKLDHLLNLYYEKYIKSQSMVSQHKVHGSLISNILGAMNQHSIAKPADYHILSKDPNEWHNLKDFKSLFLKIEKQSGAESLLSIGEFVPKNCLFPDNLDSFEKGMLSLNSAYKMNHSHSIDGFYEVFFQDRKNLLIICNTPFYPTYFNYGIITGFAKKFNVPIDIQTIHQAQGGEFKIKIR